MPVLIEKKFPPEAYLAQFVADGPCMKVGMEVWSIEGKRLMVGKVQKIVPGRGVYIERVDGTVFRTPMQSIMMAEPEGVIKKALKEPKRRTSFSTGEIKKADALGSGVNESYVVTLDDGTQGIYKPKAGEDGLIKMDMRKGTLADREVITYDIAEELGWEDLVPETVMKRGKKGYGSVQFWVDDAEVWDVSPLSWKNKVTMADKQRLTFLDILIGNIDRHGANLMINKSGRLFAIDNGYSFVLADVLKSHLGTFHGWGMEGQGISPAIKDACRRLLLRRKQITKKLVPHFGVDAVDDMWDRLEYILTSDVWDVEKIVNPVMRGYG